MDGYSDGVAVRFLWPVGTKGRINHYLVWENDAIPLWQRLHGNARNRKRMRRTGSRVWLFGVLLSVGLLLAGCSASSRAQQTYWENPDEPELGMSINDFIDLCGRPVGKEMYVENGIRYDKLIYIQVTWSGDRVITTATFENGVLTRQEAKVEGTPLSVRCED